MYSLDCSVVWCCVMDISDKEEEPVVVITKKRQRRAELEERTEDESNGREEYPRLRILDPQLNVEEPPHQVSDKTIEPTAIEEDPVNALTEMLQCTGISEHPKMFLLVEQTVEGGLRLNEKGKGVMEIDLWFEKLISDFEYPFIGNVVVMDYETAFNKRYGFKIPTGCVIAVICPDKSKWEEIDGIFFFKSMDRVLDGFNYTLGKYQDAYIWGELVLLTSRGIECIYAATVFLPEVCLRSLGRIPIDCVPKFSDVRIGLSGSGIPYTLQQYVRGSGNMMYDKNVERSIHDLIKKVLSDGVFEHLPFDGRLKLFCGRIKIPLFDGKTPLLTTRKVSFPNIISDLLWLVKGGGYRDKKELSNDFWCEVRSNRQFDGVVFGKQGTRQIRHHSTRGDQLQNCICDIKHNQGVPTVISMDMAEDFCYIEDTCVLNCQFYVHDKRLHCSVTQAIGGLVHSIPNTIVIYSLLVRMVAIVCEMEPGELVFNINEYYANIEHLDDLRIMINRSIGSTPIVLIDESIKNIDDFRPEHFKLVGYSAYPRILFPKIGSL